MITKDLEGIIINILEYKDNDLIVDVLSVDYGFIQLYVRGAQKTSSKSFYIFKIFNVIKFDLSKINLAKISMYRSGSTLTIFDYTKLNYEQMNSVMFISELLVKIKDLKDYDLNILYNNVKNIIEQINHNKAGSHLSLINVLLYQILGLVGCQLTLDQCVCCGQTRQIKVFDLDLNGFVCQNCFIEENRTISDERILKYLYNLVNNYPIENDYSSDVSVFELLYDVLSNNAGIYLKAKKYILGGV